MEFKTEINLSLKIPLELNEKIMREAEKEKRSRHSQIIYSLEKLFSEAPTDEIKNSAKKRNKNEKSAGNIR